MTLFLLQQWKKQKNGVRDAKAFLLTLESETASVHDKELVIRALDDWEVLTPTWFEVADYLPVIERLYENPSFPERERAALLASKVAFCLCDYVGALHLALSAGALFDLTPRTCPATIGPQDEQYVNKMIEQALDTYKTAKRGAATVDKRLETLIDRIFERNLQRREFRYVIGLGLDTRRVDMIERAVKESDDATTLLSETVAKVLESVVERVFRGVVLDVLLRLFGELDEPDFVSMCQCLIKLEKPTDVAEILNRLATSKIAFDLYENASQQFIAKIERALHPERGIAASDGETGGHKDEASAK